MPKLVGMKAISNYTNRSESTLIGWIRDMDFPATKIGGIWESDTALVDTWRHDRLNGDLTQQTGLDKKKRVKTETRV